ncbi:GtrA family protein [Paenibacillus endoradicis]|uniref:GtrA family protein n=1 Tax=Paenibacillus endoradicis TaxID=2972487 RepID=UPI002158ED09|nr:GtrA family protein [Paenibacillus endoradicis]MCR8659022.1 GtrA family protein [Paenibacillus endoradicis]
MNDQEQAALMDSEKYAKTISRKSLKQFIIFGIVGVSNTVVDLIIFWLLIQSSLHYIIANIVAYSVGMLNSYLWNSAITFKSKHRKNEIVAVKRIVKFIIWNGLMLLLSSALIYVVVEFMHWHALISKLVVTVFILVVQFLGSKKWVFKQE